MVMKKYTVGFIFTPGFKEVLLVHKLTPEWQNGKINGIGGKVEPGEDSVSCIVRETHEESNLVTDPQQWVSVGSLQGDEWNVDVFTYIYSGDMENAVKAGKEDVEWFEAHSLPDNVISNLRWLVPLCINKFSPHTFRSVHVDYT